MVIFISTAYKILRRIVSTQNFTTLMYKTRDTGNNIVIGLNFVRTKHVIHIGIHQTIIHMPKNS